jgi:hypothetical protein
MFLQVTGKVVITGEIVFGTEINIGMFFGVEDGIDGSFRGHPDRARRQSRITVSIIG